MTNPERVYEFLKAHHHGPTRTHRPFRMGFGTPGTVSGDAMH
jgi:hypothetical protein